ncbi:YbhB/YbcL family Raf kinase inhibitor-like protein [Candidatus Protochlamydia phocaeensis]|uniref:YbhB/YbcL family Raf kinase inhibitor-like protein n=1 Tax=Candidatus Protochlamydia phocaeensis TaxID=1414722 RepID=UPI0008396A1B|nr:YbhB/YbcL family Raf kinase inhibitor-like protein [Candidatus Protochlamydia phocaeensis]
MIIESVFEYQQPIPSKYTCSGENISPPLKFLQIPQHAQSLVLIVDDPDAPHGVFDHWIIWNISPHVTQLSEGAPELKRLSPHPIEAKNGFGKKGYGGPCPPPGKPHRYFFKLYALDVPLALSEASSKKDVEQAMKGHVIEQAELMGTYQR